MNPKVEIPDCLEIALQVSNNPGTIIGSEGLVDTQRFYVSDVSKLIASYVNRGIHNETQIVVVGQLKDKRWFSLTAFCDVTGWDCVSGGTVYVASSRKDIMRFGLGDREREQLGLT